MINKKLHYKGRYLRTHTGKMLLGPVGKRLFVDYLDKVPGFSGRVDFIHKLNITSLFTVQASDEPAHALDFETAETCWYPSLSTMDFENTRLAFHETKFITEDDCAVSCQTWTNKCQTPLTLTLTVGAQDCTTTSQEACYLLQTPVTVHGFACAAAIMWDAGQHNAPIHIPPGGKVSFTVVAAVGNTSTETLEAITQKAAGFFDSSVNYIHRHNQAYEVFFTKAPSFICSDKALETTWNYRNFLLKHNLATPDFGYLQGATMYEGRGHKAKKEPFCVAGWEFSKHINLSTPLHLLDFRWHGDKHTGREIIMNMLNNTDENGIFCSAYVSKQLHAYANFSCWAVYQFFLVDGYTEFVSKILDKLKQYVQNEAKTYSRNDHLQVEVKHNRTGKEYQPGYWYFHNYPPNPKDMTTYTPLKRVDRSVYHYLNVLGVAQLCHAINDPDASAYEAKAKAIKQDILDKMWDKDTAFFYDLHHETDQPALVKHVVAAYPFWAGITDQTHLPGLEAFFDPRYFDTGCPFPSVARDCEAYRPAGGWMDTFIKGRNGCVWCGPSWPYTTGVAIDAIGVASKANGHRYSKAFGQYLRKYALQHFRDNDLTRPYLVEHYDAETGEPLSDEVDYNHSYFMDLIVSHVCGVGITNGGVSFDPIDIGLDYFKLDNLNIRGDVYTITYKHPGCTAPEAAGMADGFKVYKNQELL